MDTTLFASGLKFGKCQAHVLQSSVYLEIGQFD